MNKKVLISLLVVIVALIVVIIVIAKAPDTMKDPVVRNETSVTHYFCDAGTIDAVFGVDSVKLTISDGRELSLPQVRSGSGIRYEKGDIAFIGKGDDAFLTEKDKTTFDNCVAGTVTDSMTDESGKPAAGGTAQPGGSVSSGSGVSTFVSNGRTFMFSYPKGFVVTSGGVGYNTNWRVNSNDSGKLLAKITSPKSYILKNKTNLSDITFTVGSSMDSHAVESCLAVQSGEVGAGIVTLGGVDYVKVVTTDAGAGNYYTTTSYRTVKNETCYALESTVHTTNLGNYSPDQGIKEYDHNAVANVVNSIVYSFRLLK